MPLARYELCLSHRVAEREMITDEMNSPSLALAQARKDRHSQRREFLFHEGEWVMVVQEVKPPKLQQDGEDHSKSPDEEGGRSA